MKKVFEFLFIMIFTMIIVISLIAQNNGFNFNKKNNYTKKNNYSKTYTYNSKTTKYYIILEVVDWECIQEGKSIEECKSLKRVYNFINKKDGN
tara:strand:+ start:168 stop:446 length:279 start_codon:yes stop_codon:yes gene_type:complete